MSSTFSGPVTRTIAIAAVARTQPLGRHADVAANAAGRADELVDTTHLEIGDLILARLGERIGADEHLVDGSQMLIKPPSPANHCRWSKSHVVRCRPGPSTGPANCRAASPRTAKFQHCTGHRHPPR